MHSEAGASAVFSLAVAWDERWPRSYTSLREFPVVLGVLADGYTLAEMEIALIPNEVALQRGEPFVTVRDVRGARRPPSSFERARVAAWQREWEALARANCVGVVTLTASAMMRSAIQAYHWIMPPVTHEAVFATPTQAAPWLAERLAAHGVEEPEILKRWRREDVPFPVSPPDY